MMPDCNFKVSEVRNVILLQIKNNEAKYHNGIQTAVSNYWGEIQIIHTKQKLINTLCDPHAD